MTTKNPWLGLASYEEKDEKWFCGRDKETRDMVRLIDNNLFVTLYGCSGIGKTSLLRAGVIPILRRKNYFPLYVRLSQEPKEISFAEAIVRKLQSSGLMEEHNAEMKYPDGNDRLYLWNYFATTRFLKDGFEVYPVIILDQFEEVFRDINKDKAELLLQQIYLLLNDELEMLTEDGWNADTNYRFMASIREDFLFVLEDSIDELSLDLYKNNRYRLRPMKREEARQVVLGPGKDCIEAESKNVIADQVVTMSERNNKDSIDTLLLSLICSEMYNIANREQGIITRALIEQLGDNILSSFYEKAMDSISPRTVKYLESHLLTQSGFRNSMALEDILHENILKEDLDKLLEKKLLRIELSEGVERIEFTHDALCAMAKRSRDKQIEENNKKYQNRVKRRINVGYFFDVFAPFLLTIAIVANPLIIPKYGLFVPVFLLSLVYATCIILVPYRHCKEKNVKWFSLIAMIINGICALSFLFLYFLEDSNDDIELLSLACCEFLIAYSIVQFALSLRFKKKMKFRESIKQLFTFQIYKDFPTFKMILLALSLFTSVIVLIVKLLP